MTPQDKKDWIEIIVSALEIYDRQKDDRLYHRTLEIEQELIQGYIKKHGQALAAKEGNTVEATLEKLNKLDGKERVLVEQGKGFLESTIDRIEKHEQSGRRSPERKFLE